MIFFQKSDYKKGRFIQFWDLSIDFLLQINCYYFCLAPQFTCIKCEKQFRQPIVYHRHREKCSDGGDEDEEQPSKGKSSSTSHQHTITSRSASTSSSSTTTLNNEPRSKRQKSVDSTSTNTSTSTTTTRLALTRRTTTITTKPSAVSSSSSSNVATTTTTTTTTSSSTSNKKPQEPVVAARRGRPRKHSVPVSDVKKEPNDDHNEEDNDNDADDQIDEVVDNASEVSSNVSKPRQRLRSFNKPTIVNETLNKKLAASAKKKPPMKGKILAKRGRPRLKMPTPPKPKMKTRREAKLEAAEVNNQPDESVQNDLDDDEDDDELTEDNLSTATNINDDLEEVIVSDYEMDNETAEQPDTADEPTVGDVKSSACEAAPTSTIEPAMLANALLEPTKDLGACGTYKVKIVPRRQSSSINNNNNNTAKSNAADSNTDTPQTPQKLNIKLNNVNTPSKSLNGANSSTSTSSSNLLAAANAPATPSAHINNFECPECDKKFVSYYGLLQHYDQHPTLAVTCAFCEITFDNHHALVLHNTNVHHLNESSANLANITVKDKDKEK